MIVANESGRARWVVWAAVAALGWFLFRQLSLEWGINPQYSYGWVVPVLMGYLVLERWRDRPMGEVGRVRWVWFLFFLGLVAGVRVFQEANPDWRLLSWVAALCVVGLGFLFLEVVGGRSWVRHFGFAVGFVLVAVPWPTEVENLLVQSLMRGVAGVTVEFLNWAGIAAQQEGNLIRLAGGTLGVDEACSGVRSFQGTLMAALFFGELYRLSVARRVALLGVGVGMALTLNMGRAILLAVLASKYGMEAVNRWHDPAGWVLLLVTFFGLLGVGRFLGGTRRVEERSETPYVVSYRKIGWACWVVVGWLVVCEVGTRAWYSAHERGQVLATRWGVDWRGVRRVEISENVRLILRFNEGEARVWDRADGSRWHLFFFHWKPGRAAASLARSHRPETCLPSTGFSLAADRGVKLHRVGGLELPVERLDFQNGGKLWHVYYCLWEDRVSGRAPLLSLTREARVRAVLEGRRHLGQRVLEVVIGGMDSAERADAAFAEALEKWIVVDKNS